MFKGRFPNYDSSRFDSSSIERDFSVGMRVSQFRNPSPVESFYLKDTKCVHSSVPAVKVTSDIYMLFNQHRLDKMTNANLLQWLSDSSSTSDSLASLRKNVKDEDLVKFIKSRYIQSQSELLSYSRYLELCASEFEVPVSSVSSDSSASLDSDSDSSSSSSSSSGSVS